MRALLLTVGLAIGGIAAQPVAPAGAAWRTLADVPAGLHESPVLVGDRGGAALAAWVTFPADRAGVPTDPGAAGLLELIERPPGAAPFAPSPLAGSGAHVRALSGGGDGHGGVILAWRQGASGGLHLAFGTTLAGVGAPQAVRGAGNLPPARAQIGGDERARAAVTATAAGDGLIAWLARARTGCGYAVRAAVLARGHTTFTGGRTISPSCGHASSPRVVLDPEGSGAVVWVAGPPRPTKHTIMVARVARGHVGAARALTATAAPYAPALAMDDAHRLVVAWRAFSRLERRDLQLVRGRVMVTTGTRTRSVSVTDRIFGSPRVATGDDGTLAVAWQSGNPLPGLGPVQVAVRAPDRSAFTAPQSLAGGGSIATATLHVGVDAVGDTAVLFCSGRSIVTLGIRTAGSAPAAPEVASGDTALASNCGGPVQPGAGLAVDAAGGVLVLLPHAGGLALAERAAPLG